MVLDWQRFKLNPSFLLTASIAVFCLLSVSVFSFWVLGSSSAPYFIASMGAAAVLMFCTPKSPMATYRALILGNLLSATVGVSCKLFLPESIVVGPVAVGIAICVMQLFRCQHPPGGATALIAVIGGPDIYELQYQYVVTPVAVNVAIFLVGVILHRQWLSQKLRKNTINSRMLSLLKKNKEQDRQYFNQIYVKSDIDKTMEQLGSYMDVTPEQVNEVVQLTLLNARSRKVNRLTCREAMRGETATAEFGDHLLDAWRRMNAHGVHYLVVVDRHKKVQGILKMSALIELVHLNSNDSDLYNKLEEALSPSQTLHSDKPEAVGQMMEPVITVNPDDDLTDMMMKGEEVVVVVDEQHRYMGMIEGDFR